MPYTAITSDEIQVKKPVRQELWQKVKNNFDAHEGQLAAAGAGAEVPNGSFETDSDNDGIPDGWTRSLYPGGAGDYETTSPAHGARAYRFTHPGGAGNGGGYLESDYIEVTEFRSYILGFIHWASASTMRNQIYVRYFDKAKTYLSETAIYDSVANPTSAIYFVRTLSPPANARYIKTKLIGGFTDTNVAGTAYFDDISLSEYSNFNQSRDAHLSEKTTTSISWVDVGSVTISDVPEGVVVRFGAELVAVGVATTAYMRWRIGTSYSNEVNTTATSYTSFDFSITPTGPNTGRSVSLTLQLMSSNYEDVYGRKTGSFRYILTTI